MSQIPPQPVHAPYQAPRGNAAQRFWARRATWQKSVVLTAALAASFWGGVWAQYESQTPRSEWGVQDSPSSTPAPAPTVRQQSCGWKKPPPVYVPHPMGDRFRPGQGHYQDQPQQWVCE